VVQEPLGQVPAVIYYCGHCLRDPNFSRFVIAACDRRIDVGLYRR